MFDGLWCVQARSLGVGNAELDALVGKAINNHEATVPDFYYFFKSSLRLDSQPL